MHLPSWWPFNHDRHNERQRRLDAKVEAVRREREALAKEVARTARMDGLDVLVATLQRQFGEDGEDARNA